MAVVRVKARELTAADGVTFVLRDGGQCHYAEENAIGPLWKGRRFPAESCISGWAMIHREDVVLPDIYADPRIPADAYRPTFVRSLAMVPVRREEPIAAIGAYWASQHRASERELWLLHTLADSTALALANVALYGDLQRKAQEYASLYESAQQEIATRERLEAQFVQAQKMEAIGRLAGGVAHDFNNQLFVIRGYAELLLHQVPTGSPQRTALEEIQKAADRSSALTTRLLAFSRKQVLQPEVIDLNAQLREIQTMLRRVLGEDIELEVAYGPDVGRVEIDPPQLEQAVANLAINARDAMPDGGKLTIETRRVTIDAEEAFLVPDLNAGTYFTLSVADTGCGMDEATLQRVFEPFFTTKPAGKGTGLGLAMVHGFVKQSGGHIAVQSEPGRGTTLTIYLPALE